VTVVSCDENVAALSSLSKNKNGQKGDRHLNKCRAYPSGSQRCKKAKDAKMRERKKLQPSEEIFKQLFDSGSEVQRRHWDISPNLYEARKSNNML